jgi:putative NADPH-quinone reductase
MNVMRIYAILAHPKKDSLSGRLFYTTVEHLKSQGVDVDVLDLYEYINQIPYFVPSPSQGWGGQGLEKHSFYQENKARFMAADRLFIVYPIYWYAVPGIMKSWLDLITNYAWKFEGGPYGIPLHPIKKALVVNSASMSNWFRWLRTRNSGSEMLKESFKFLGIKDYSFYEIGSTGSLTKAKVDRHQAKILKLSQWLTK